MFKKLTFTILLFSVLILNGQTKMISGIVSDESGPLPGVTVLEKGTANGTETDFDGKYSLKVSEKATLVFSFVGMKTTKVKIKNKTIVNVLMEGDNLLEEVVVAAYGISSRSTRKPKRINKLHQKISNQLQRGSSVNKNIRIRGTNCSGCNLSKPLYIIDGVPIKSNYNSIIKNIDSKEIESVNVYKSYKAKRFFGESAKNGCIVITTKKGNYRIEDEDAYARIYENQFKNVNTSPLSTFSIDVDKASYSNIRRMINNGQKIPSDAVKIEEMINYFDYNYPQPQDEHPFSINTELVKTPWNSNTKLVRIGLQGKEYKQENLPASNLTFLIDVSGSMGSSNKLPLLKKAFKLLTNQLREKDRVSIVVYAGAAGVVLKPTSGNNKDRILKALDNLEAGGSTAGGRGIELAYKLAKKNFVKNGNNRVILATDGDFNVGASSNKAMEELIEEKRKSGVFLSVLGFGYGNYKDDKLEVLADKGNGNHAYIDTMQEAQKVFGKEFGGTLFIIAKDVKIQVEFNPKKVQAYRLIGYENRLLNDEDFVDDTKDAGELGSGHTVTALYEVVPVGVESKYLKNIPKLKYTKNNNQDKYNEELLTVKFRYKEPSKSVSKEIVKVMKDVTINASDDMKFIASVALFGMQLKKSAFTNNAKKKDVLKLANSGSLNDENGYRKEFVRLVKSL
ncbi:von Willebrand factor type A domain-containing protein [Tenacibaculum sp. S7007]|uniref:von Willebrand factor type A domain-containing protein n=1 Tax=Tenacibaculum pelagium TaxID=2759527 RepID=A0A839ALU2_9FLAO|nr:VWA domain-containing protein [Tenacibaculum pelagium]MBA6155358.1 von Willebrand factor type A domain-containing protein [Tenacibaculum pelagium]